jgi:YVTN family beta-propeller protein
MSATTHSNMKLTKFVTVRFALQVATAKRRTRLLDHAQAKSVLLSSILVLATILSCDSTGLSQESVGSKLHTESGLPTNQLVTTIPLGINVFPTAIVVSPDSKTIYVTSFSTDGSLVSIVDTGTNTVTDTIPVGGIAYYLAITPDGSALYVGNTGSTTSPASVYVISTATKSVTATIEMFPDGLAMSPSGKKVYVTNPDHKAISIIETATNKFIAHAIGVGDLGENVAVSPNGRLAYLKTAENAVLAIDLVTKQVVATIPLEPSNDLPVCLTFNPNGQRLYLNTRKHVFFVNTSSNTVVRSILMPIVAGGNNNYAGQTAITPDGNFLYVPYPNGNTIAMVDTVTHKPAGSQVSVGSPIAIAVAPTTPFAYAIGNYTSGNNDEAGIYVINISPE